LSNTSAPPRRPAAVLLAAVCLWSLHPGVARSATNGPRAVVDRTTSSVLAVLADNNLSSDDKRRKIEDIVYVEVDFDTLSRLVLAKNWGRLSSEQQKEFVREFKRHLSLTYGRNVDNYKNEKVSIIGDREEARGDWTVQSKILRGGPDDFAVDYRLRQKDGTWRIIDIIIEGVSLVSNFRSQFQEIIANGGPERLLQLLREKNAKGEPLKS
jgi:phospholipid transport system substrate-binding protein